MRQAPRAAMQHAGSGAQQDNGVMLTIFMEGTANPMEHITTQIALFSRLCPSKPLNAKEAILPDLPGHYKLSFDGCGVSHGLSGTIFATGLREQCDLVNEYVTGFLARHKQIQINFVGLSRGGIGGLYLAQTLNHFGPEFVTLNMLLYDPVPGNLVFMARYLDIIGISNTNQCMDVSACRNLGHVMVLYPHEPLPAVAVHAPVIAKFPPGCNLEQDVLLGCHQGALWLRPRADTCHSFALIRDFLLRHGSELDLSRGAGRDLGLSDEQLASALDRELKVNLPTDRCAHSPTGQVQIVRHPQGCFLNRAHEALLRRIADKQTAAGQRQPGAPLVPPGGHEGPQCPRYMLDFAAA